MTARRPGVAVAVLAVLAWLPSLRVGFLTDDFDLLGSMRPGLAGFGHALTAYGPEFWRPLTELSLRLDRSLWGTAAPGYHLTNVALHAVNSVLVLALARRLGSAPRAAAIAAAWFALNPAAIGAVGWVAGRASLLAVTFAIGAALALTSASTAVLVLLALLSKETGVVAVGWIACLAVLEGRVSANARRLAAALLVTVVYLLVRSRLVGFHGYAPLLSVEPLGGLRMLTCLAFPLSDGVYGSALADVLASGLALALLGIGLARRAAQRPAAVAAALLVVSLLPVTGLLFGPRSLYHSRHYYMPAVALAVLLGLALESVRRRATLAAAGVVLVGLAQLDIAHWARNGALARSIVDASADAFLRQPQPAGPLYVTGFRDMEGPYFLFHGMLSRAVATLRPEVGDQIQCADAYACPRLSELPAAPVLALRVEGFRLAP